MMTYIDVCNDVCCRSYCDVASGSFVMDSPNLKEGKVINTSEQIAKLKARWFIITVILNGTF